MTIAKARAAFANRRTSRRLPFKSAADVCLSDSAATVSSFSDGLDPRISYIVISLSREFLEQELRSVSDHTHTHLKNSQSRGLPRLTVALRPGEVIAPGQC